MATFQRLGHRVGQKYNFSVALIFYVISTLHYFIDRNMVFKFHTLVFKNLRLYSDRKQKTNKQTKNLISIDTGVVNSLLKCVLTHFIYPSKSEFFLRWYTCARNKYQMVRTVGKYEYQI